MLDVAQRPEDMKAPGWHLHPLRGNLQGFWAVTVSANWRITFRFDGKDAILVDYQDYH
jgi:proteic killer suppression protein